MGLGAWEFLRLQVLGLRGSVLRDLEWSLVGMEVAMKFERYVRPR